MRAQPWISATLAGLVCCLACRPERRPDESIAKLTPEQAADVRRTIVAWLECEECDAGERDSVVALGAVAVPTLAAVLKEGPSPAKLELLRRSLADTYAKLQAYGRTHKNAAVKLSQQQYIDLYTANYVALYQVRAAEALGAIGRPEARRALEDGLKSQLREDARAAVEAALAAAKRRSS